MKETIMAQLEEIVDRSIELIERDNQDEISGVALRLSKSSRNGSVVDTLEFTLLALIIEKNEEQ